jgi:hypothetical protein
LAYVNFTLVKFTELLKTPAIGLALAPFSHATTIMINPDIVVLSLREPREVQL